MPGFLQTAAMAALEVSGLTTPMHRSQGKVVSHHLTEAEKKMNDYTT